jgi:hypothetical protein
MQRVEDAAIERHQRNQQQIGKRDARELDGEREPPRIMREAGREELDHRRGEHQRDGEEHELDRKQQREDAIREQRRRPGALGRADARIGRHEGRVERALGENGAEMIGQAERHEERIRHRAGAQDGRQHDVAREAGETRHQRQAADREDAFDHDNRPSTSS